jgi:hypothetical protein
LHGWPLTGLQTILREVVFRHGPYPAMLSLHGRALLSPDKQFGQVPDVDRPKTFYLADMFEGSWCGTCPRAEGFLTAAMTRVSAKESNMKVIRIVAILAVTGLGISGPNNVFGFRDARRLARAEASQPRIDKHC